MKKVSDKKRSEVSAVKNYAKAILKESEYLYWLEYCFSALAEQGTQEMIDVAEDKIEALVIVRKDGFITDPFTGITTRL